MMSRVSSAAKQEIPLDSYERLRQTAAPAVAVLTTGKAARGLLLASLLSLVVSGCSSIVASATQRLADDLSAALLSQQDLGVVRDGAPAFLITLDALLQSNPENASLLLAGASLNSAYATAFVEDDERQKRFADKAFDFAQRAACAEWAWSCDARTMSFDAFDAKIATLKLADVPVAYGWATSWAGWIQAHSDDWNAVAELARVKSLVNRVAELDEAYDFGGPRLYQAVLESLLPPAMGGRPEVGRTHFERAIELSEGRYLMAKVLFAEQYARLVFDQELHDQLLNEVLEANPEFDGLTLINTLAQEQARSLLETSVDYF